MGSFLKETLRIYMVGAGNSIRTVVSPGGFTFSDGLYVPAGVTVCVYSEGVHLDPKNYYNPEAFDAFRFGSPFNAQAGLGDTSDAPKVHWTMPSSTFLTFGGGNNVCPGRRLADIQLRIALSYFLENYEFSLPPIRPAKTFMWLFQTPPLY
ncbi:cytochrome P450, partial [Wilcoxina mikolae CBS 423.85]